MTRYFNKTTILFITLFLSIICHAQNIPDRPTPPRLVNDFTCTLSNSQINSLEHKLVAYNDSTSTQIAVVLVNDLDGTTVADYAYKLGEKWGVGTKENNGIVILVKPKNENGNGQVNISTGYGLEAYVPDALAKRIIEKEMIPAFKMNDYYSGINNAVDVIIGLASGAFSAEEYSDESSETFILIFFIVMMIIMILFINFTGKIGKTYSSKHDDSSVWKALFWASVFSNSSRHNHHWGNFSGGSGGFGGGGGFGGFGGGSFGGGGASGSW